MTDESGLFPSANRKRKVLEHGIFSRIIGERNIVKIEVSSLKMKFSTSRETYILWSLVEGLPEFLNIRKLFREIFIEFDGVNEKSLKYDEECEECYYISGRDHTSMAERNGEYEETDLRDGDETPNEIEYREESPIDMTIYISYRRDNALKIFDFSLSFF